MTFQEKVRYLLQHLSVHEIVSELEGRACVRTVYRWRLGNTPKTKNILDAVDALVVRVRERNA